MMIHLMTEGQRAAGLPAWEAGSATPDFPRGIAWPPDLPGLWAQMGGEAQPRCCYFGCSSPRPKNGSKVEEQGK